MKKIIFTAIFYLIAITQIYSVSKNQSDSVKAYRNALTAFDAQDYGKALKYSEDAILYRKQIIEKEIETLKTSLSSKRVQAVGDGIDSVLKILTERKEYDSINIIESYTKIKGKDYFDNSIQKLLKYMQESMVYPEAHKLIADIYKLEGEYNFAEEYYMLALKNSDVLDVPDEKYDILYLLAEISRLQNDFPKMETRLLNILAEDEYFKDKGLNTAMLGTIKTDKKGTMEKLFNLYRTKAFLSINAYNQLAEYYYDNNELEKALNFSLMSAVTSFTKVSEILESRNSDYTYSNLSTFFQEASFYDDIVEWGNENKIWSSFNILARYAKENGYKTFARELLIVLVQFNPNKYWQKDAVLMLETLD
ncbi:MAG: hypothetical protein HUJ68_14325 [Clostridia bacterium]|nr:hypothetical protein [Clostridia bacterium]